MEEKIEIVYYQFTSTESFTKNLENAKRLINSRNDNELMVSSIEYNNRCFLEELERIKIKGYENLDLFLREQISFYIKRKSSVSEFTYNDYFSWLRNTKLITNNIFPVVVEWCNEYESFIKSKMIAESK